MKSGPLTRIDRALSRVLRPAPSYVPWAPSPVLYIKAPAVFLVGLFMFSRGYVLGGLILTGVGLGGLCQIVDYHAGVDTSNVGCAAYLVGMIGLAVHFVRTLCF